MIKFPVDVPEFEAGARLMVRILEDLVQKPSPPNKLRLIYKIAILNYMLENASHEIGNTEDVAVRFRIQSGSPEREFFNDAVYDILQACSKADYHLIGGNDAHTSGKGSLG